MIQETLIKHKGVLDQFRNGLAILGPLKEIQKAPSKFEHKKVKINADFVKSLLCLPDSTNPRLISVTRMLLSFIDSANEDVLCKFLGFLTGWKSATLLCSQVVLMLLLKIPQTFLLQLVTWN